MRVAYNKIQNILEVIKGEAERYRKSLQSTNLKEKMKEKMKENIKVKMKTKMKANF